MNNNAVTNDRSADELSWLIRSYKAKKYFSIGNVIRVCGMELEIIGFDHDKDFYNPKLPTITVRTLFLMPPQKIGVGDSDEGWICSDVRKFLEGDFMATIRHELVGHMVYTEKISHDYKNREYSTIDRVFLPSESELFGTGIFTEIEDGARYEAFCNARIRVGKTNDGVNRPYWTRSMVSGTKDRFVAVNTVGTAENVNGYSDGICLMPCFAIS